MLQAKVFMSKHNCGWFRLRQQKLTVHAMGLRMMFGVIQRRLHGCLYLSLSVCDPPTSCSKDKM